MAWQRTALLGFLTCAGLLNFARAEAAVVSVIAIPLWLAAVGEIVGRPALPAPRPRSAGGSRSTVPRRILLTSTLSAASAFVALCYLAVPARLR
jgi:hypothetical protein